MKSTDLNEHEKTARPYMLIRRMLFAAFLTVAVLCAFGMADLLTTASASAKEVLRLSHEPNNPKIHQVYFNTTDNREYIYNGQEWVPHDASIDTYVLKKYQKPVKPSSGHGQNNAAGSSNNQGASK